MAPPETTISESAGGPMDEDSGDIRPIKKAKRATFDALGIQWSPENGTTHSLPLDNSSTTPRAVFSSQFSSPMIPARPGCIFMYTIAPPKRSIVASTLEDHGQPSKIYRNPWYSKASDAPERPREYAGLVYHLKGGTGLGILDEWEDSIGTGEDDAKLRVQSSTLGLAAQSFDGWEYAGLPPGHRQVAKWVAENPIKISPTRAKINLRTQASKLIHM